MIPDKLKDDFNSLRNMFDELKREIDKNVVREENYKGEFYEISPYSYQRNRFKQGKIVGNVTSLKTTNNLFTYYFDVKNQIIEIREGLELKNQFYYTFFIYEKELMKTIAYDNSKRIVNVRYYLYDFTLDFMMDERARELFYEAQRRTDLIRFGKYTSADYVWPWKGGVAAGKSVESFYQVFPLPSDDVGSNQNLVQNEGY